ncbi:MAG: HAD-IA family hydrolase [Deltaproteobacteria bacterium]|nr:HAD-IA family hydrolase [Deltaproteobacteria bacterium]
MRAAIFDLDGTLVDTHRDLARGVNAALESLGYAPLPVEHVRQLVGNGVVNLLARALSVAESDPAVALARRVFDVEYLAHVADESAPYLGVRELIATIQARGVRVAIATNKPRAFSRRLLDTLKIARFDALACADEVRHRKPAADVLALAARRVDAAPCEVVFVGDSPVDLDSARAFGSRFLGVGWGFQAKALADRGVPILESVAQLEEALGFTARKSGGMSGR